MTKNDKKHPHIYVPHYKERINCTQEEFNDYYRDINAYRRTQQNHGRCECPRHRRYDCNMDCWTCPHHRPGDLSSLDRGLTDEDGEEMDWLQELQNTRPDLQTPSVEDLVADTAELHEILVRLCELLPHALEIAQYRLQGLSDDAISSRIGTPRTTFTSRIKKARKVLEQEYPDFF